MLAWKKIGSEPAANTVSASSLGPLQALCCQPSLTRHTRQACGKEARMQMQSATLRLGPSYSPIHVARVKPPDLLLSLFYLLTGTYPARLSRHIPGKGGTSISLGSSLHRTNSSGWIRSLPSHSPGIPASPATPTKQQHLHGVEARGTEALGQIEGAGFLKLYRASCSAPLDVRCGFSKANYPPASPAKRARPPTRRRGGTKLLHNLSILFMPLITDAAMP